MAFFWWPKKANNGNAEQAVSVSATTTVAVTTESVERADLSVDTTNSLSSMYVGLQSPSPPRTSLSASPPVSHDVVRSQVVANGVKSTLRTPSPKRRKRKPKSNTTKAPKNPISPFKLPPLPPSPASTKLSLGGARLSLGGPLDPLIHDSIVDFETQTQQRLNDLIKSVPPRTLHDYVLAQLPKLPPSELISLSGILSELEPPPIRHCVRCHKDFNDVENDDHSCLIAHDDDSATVQHASGNHSKAGIKGYETFWACCGQTVEGQGDLGPPSGWCYEGKHTVDQRRARWRDDSTPQEDKLPSCEASGCLKKILPTSPRRARDRGTKRLREEDDEEADAVKSVKSTRRRASPSPSAMSVRSTRSVARRAVSPAMSFYTRRSPSVTPSEDIDMAPSDTSKAKSKPHPKRRSEIMKPRSRSKSVTSTIRKAEAINTAMKKPVSKAMRVLIDAASNVGTPPPPNRVSLDLEEPKATGAAKKIKNKKRRVS